MINFIYKFLEKILDPGQLPPIKETGEDGYLSDEDSPAFTWFKDNMIVLTKKVRQTEGNPIIELTDFIYKEIFSTHDLASVLQTMSVPNYNEGIGYTMLKYVDFLRTYTSVTTSYIDSKILAYRNDTVNYMNDSIRNFIYNNPTQEIIEGELIYMSSTFQCSRKGFLYNSDEYLIDSIHIVVEKEVECYKCIVNKGGHDHLINEHNPFFLIPTAQGKIQFQNVSIQLKRFAIQEKDNFKKKKAWARYLNYINNFATISYGYCYTSHKSQGSTFKNVFVDVNDIITSTRLSNKRKLQALYTAITRASHSVYFLH
jgi:hypothetical protein